MNENVKKYIALMEEWSNLILDGKEKEGFALMEQGTALEEKFTREDWEQLIDFIPNKQAKIAWTEKMNKLFPKK